MLKKDTYEFLLALKSNNNREWFSENKAWYERAKADFEVLVTQVILHLNSFDSQIGHLDPKKCIFRIYRDIRFSQDKTPYKEHFGAGFRPLGSDKTSGYYLHIDPEGSFISCGHYMLNPEQLKKMRRGIYNDYETFRSILDNKEFKKEIGDLYRDDDILKRIPNGFDKDSPATEYLKLKHFYVYKPIPENLLFDKNLIEYISNTYRLMQPLGTFLNELLLD